MSGSQIKRRAAYEPGELFESGLRRSRACFEQAPQLLRSAESNAVFIVIPFSRAVDHAPRLHDTNSFESDLHYGGEPYGFEVSDTSAMI